MHASGLSSTCPPSSLDRVPQEGAQAIAVQRGGRPAKSASMKTPRKGQPVAIERKPSSGHEGKELLLPEVPELPDVKPAGRESAGTSSVDLSA